MSGAWGAGSTRRWRRIRAAVLARDNHRCQLGLEGCATVADCVHHLDGKAAGDRMDRLVAACTPCNLKVGDPTGADPEPTPRTDWT